MPECPSLSGLRIGLLTDWVSLRGGGIPPMVLAQADLIASCGGDPQIFALADPHAADQPRAHGAIPIELAPVQGTDRFGFAPDLVRRLLAADLDLLHLHGIWLYPSWAALRWARETERPYILSSHGMLAPWLMARGKLQKYLARRAYLGANLREVDVLHALTDNESADFARESGRTDAKVIPNPGPTPSAPPLRMPPPTIVFIGRFHDKKNLLALVEGWTRTSALPADARLIIAGFGTAGETARLRNAVSGTSGVELREAVFGEEKAQLLHGARFVVLPSFSEGLPVAILEAWAAGIPTIQTAECNLPEGPENGAALLCRSSAKDIARALDQAMKMEEGQWLARSRAAQALAGGTFSSAAVTGQWCEIYARLGCRSRAL